MKLKLDDNSSESLHQIHFISWFRKTFDGVLIWSNPMGGHRHISVAMKLKAEGSIRGVPDLYVPKWHLWVEMKKAKGGYLSRDQKKIIKYLEEECGDTVIVGKGFEDAKRQIEEFVKNI